MKFFGAVTEASAAVVLLAARAFERVTVFKPTVSDVANDVKIGSVDAGIVWEGVRGKIRFS